MSKFGRNLKVEEEDGSPSVVPTHIVQVPNGSLTQDSTGKVSLDFVGGSLPTTYLKIDQTTPQTIINDVPLLESTRTIDKMHQLVDKKYVDDAVTAFGARFYMTNTGSGVTQPVTAEEYYLTAPTDPAVGFSVDFTGLVNAQFVTGWISPVGVAFSKLIAGMYDWNLFAARTAGTRTLRIYWTLVERKADNSETVIATSSTSDEIDTKRRLRVPLTLSNDYTITAGSRIVGKVYAVVGASGSAPTITLYGGGVDDSHWEIPTNTEILANNFVTINQETSPQVITAADATITASDEVYYGDVTDSTKIKKDTVQGILDLVPATTSIKNTRTFGRTWNTGDSAFIKTKQVFLADANFVRVYADDVLLTYETDWTFNTTVGKKLGSVASLTDGVEILSPVDGTDYRVEPWEFVIPFQPIIGLYRADGIAMCKGMPQNSIGGSEGPVGLLKSITETDRYTYTLTFQDGASPTFTRPYYSANRACCVNYDKDAAMPTNWRIEVYKRGRNWAGRRGSASASQIETMNSCMSPRAVYTTNTINLDPYCDRKRSSQFWIRLRNTSTNEVSLFSVASVRIRPFFYYSRTWTGLGRFYRASLV